MKKTIKKLFTSVFILVGSLVLSTADASVDVPAIRKIRHTTLNNGLEVVVIENKRAPVVYHALWYKTGSADSPRDKTGLAHFLEHLMFKGTEKYPENSYKELINEFGGMQNATTNWDYTQYYATVASMHLDKVMQLEADRMRNLTFTDQEVEIEKNVVLQERFMRVGSQPNAWLHENINECFFWEHPYGKPVIGYAEHIQAYTTKDARDFYNTWYHPNNAILVVSGDVTFDDVVMKAKKYYGIIPRGTVKERVRPKEPEHRNISTKVELKDPQTGNFFAYAYPAPNMRNGGVKKALSLSLLEIILGDSAEGIFVDTLVGNYKPLYHLKARYTGEMLDPFSFVLLAYGKNPYEVQTIEGWLESILANFLSTGVQEKTLSWAKEKLLLELDYVEETLGGMAELVGRFVTGGVSVDEIKSWPAVIQTITIQDVTDAAKEIFRQPPRVQAYTFRKSEK